MTNYLIMTGGLGNQMFQYAFLLALRHNGFNAVIDISYYDYFRMHNGYELGKIFGINEKTRNKQGLHMIWLRLMNKFRPSFIYKADPLVYNIDILNNPPRYLFGYWQNENYFKDIESVIRETFCFQLIDKKNLDIAEEMRHCNSVSLHIRRGDYIDFGVATLGQDYYKKAIDVIISYIDNPVFYIFSDDVKESERLATSIGINFKLISHNRGTNSYKDMFLMSQCHHNILANSSFSWWGAWLNKNKDKIVIAVDLWDPSHVKFRPQLPDWILIK